VVWGDEVRVLNRTRINGVNYRLAGGRAFIELGKAPTSGSLKQDMDGSISGWVKVLA